VVRESGIDALQDIAKVLRRGAMIIPRIIGQIHKDAYRESIFRATGRDAGVGVKGTMVLDEMREGSEGSELGHDVKEDACNDADVL